MWIFLFVLLIIVFAIAFSLHLAKKKQKQVEDAVNRFYKILSMEGEDTIRKIANAGILYALVDRFFLEVPQLSSFIKRTQIYIAFARKNGFSEEEIVHVKKILFDNIQCDKNLSPEARVYADFLDELSESVSHFIENFKSGATLIDEIEDVKTRDKLINKDEDKKIATLRLEFNIILQKFISHEKFPDDFSNIGD